MAVEGADRKQEVGSSDSLLLESLRSTLLFPFHCLPSAGAVLERHCALLPLAPLTDNSDVILNPRQEFSSN